MVDKNDNTTNWGSTLTYTRFDPKTTDEIEREKEKDRQSEMVEEDEVSMHSSSTKQSILDSNS